MSSGETCDYPTVVVAGVYPRASPNADSQFFLSSQNKIKELSRSTMRQYQKNLQQIFKETVESKAALSKHTISIDKTDYYITLLPISDDSIGLFLCDKCDEFFKTFKMNENEPALSSLPFLDGTLTCFLSRSEIYGPEFAKSKNKDLLKPSNPKQDNGKMSRRVSIGETFSLEEVFRTFDVDGTGQLTIENFRNGLRSAGLTISDKDSSLVFNAMAYRTMKPKTPQMGNSNADEQKVIETNNDDEKNSDKSNQTTVSYFQFYSFFDGSQINKIASMAQASPIVVSPNSLQGQTFPALLGTVNEDVASDDNEDGDNGDDGNIEVESASDNDDESKKSEKKSKQIGNLKVATKLPTGAANKVMQKHILKVKQTIFECLNMGSDHTLFRDFSVSGHTSPVKSKKAHARQTSFDIENESKAKIDVEKALTKLNHCDTLKKMMQDNIFQCPTQQDVLKWDNRYRAHNLRIQSFREILNGALTQQMRKLRQDLEELGVNDDDNGNGSGMNGAPSLGVAGSNHRRGKSKTKLELTDAVMDQWNNGPPSPNPRSAGAGHAPSHSRQLSRGHSRYRSKGSSLALSDLGDDLSSVDSDADLIYVPGKELKGEKIEELLAKFREKNKENRSLRKKIKSGEIDLKNQKMVFDKDLKKLQTKLDDANGEISELKSSLAEVKSKLRDLARNKKNPKTNSRNAKLADADTQREMSKLNREIKQLRKDLEQETVQKEAALQRVRQLLKAAKRLEEDDTGNENGTISQRKIARLEKDLANKENELNAKRKKFDEMFIKLKTYESKLNTLAEENSANKAKVAGLNKRIQEIEAEKEKLQARADEKSKVAGEVKSLTSKVNDLKEKLTRMRARNQKLKLKIEMLMEKISNLEKLQSESTKLRKDLLELEKEKRKIMSQKDANSKEMQDKLAALESIMRDKEKELENVIAELNRFKEELSQEYASVKELQESLEEKEQIIKDKDEEISVQIAKLEALVEHNEKLASQYKKRFEKAEQQKDELRAKFNEMQSNTDDFKSEMSELKSQLTAKDNEIELLKHRQMEAEHKIQTQEIMSNELQNKVDRIEELETNIRIVKEEEIATKEQFEMKCQNYDELLSKWEGLSKQEEALNNKIEELRRKIKTLESKKMKESDEAAVKLKQFDIQSDQIDKLKKEVSMLKMTNQRLKGKADTAKEGLTRKEQECEKLKFDNEGLENQIRKLKKKIKEYEKKLGMTGVGKDKDKSAMALMEQNVDTLTEQVRNKDFEIKKLKNQLAAVGKGGDMDEDKKKLEKAKEFEMELKKKEDECDDLKMKITTMEGEIEVLKKQLTTKNDKLTELYKEKEEYEMKLDKIEATEQNSETNNRRLSSNINKQQKTITSLNTKILDLESKLEKYKDIEAEKSKVDTEYQNLKAEMEDLLSKLPS